jgi:hypothetical protein
VAGWGGNQDDCDEDSSCSVELQAYAQGSSYHQSSTAVPNGSSIIASLITKVFTTNAGSGDYAVSMTGYNNDTGANPAFTICSTCSASHVLVRTIGGVTYALGQQVSFVLPQSVLTFQFSLYLDGQTIVLNVQNYNPPYDGNGNALYPACGLSGIVCRVDVNDSQGAWPSSSLTGVQIVPLASGNYQNNSFYNVTDNRPWANQ